jgi:hypothetical protein
LLDQKRSCPLAILAEVVFGRHIITIKDALSFDCGFNSELAPRQMSTCWRGQIRRHLSVTIGRG